MKKKDLVRQLKEKTGLSERSIWGYLNGKKTVKYTTARKLAKALGVPVETFLVMDKEDTEELQNDNKGS